MRTFVNEVTVPGKVLLLGGYAVLYSYPGLSVAVHDKYKKGITTKIYKEEDTTTYRARIVSKQFGLDIKNPMKTEINNRNRIVLTAYKVAHKYLKGIGIDVEKNSYIYEITNSYIFGCGDEKSGMGSSAAATVSLIKAVLEANTNINTNIESGRNILHKLSQVSHALATGKIGSGFDIATSVYGTIIYKRFDKKIMEGISLENFTDLIGKKWTGLETKPYNFPYKLLIFNVLGGRTSTIKSVSSAKKLMKSNPNLYFELIKEQANAEEKVLEGINKLDSEQIRENMNIARNVQRRISKEVEKIEGPNGEFTPIEPPKFTNFIDKILNLNLAIAGRCPGGGGYDSIVFVVDNKENVSNKAISKIMDISKDMGIKLDYVETEN